MIRTTATVCALTLVAGLASIAAAQAPRRLGDKDLEALLDRIEESGDRFEESLDRAIDSGPLDGTLEEDEIERYLEDFLNGVDQLEGSWKDGGRATTLVMDLLTRGTLIDRFVATRPVGPLATSDWTTVRARLTELASAYGVPGHWRVGRFPTDLPSRRMDDEEVEALVDRIEEQADRFEDSLEEDLERARLDDSPVGVHARVLLEGLEGATDRLHDRFDTDDQAADVVSQVLWQARRIDYLMERHRFGPRAEADWSRLKTEIRGLAGGYGVTTWALRVP